MASVGSRAKNWTFTIHLTDPLPAVAPGEDEQSALLPGWPWTGLRFGVYQPEICPTSGRWHLQGYAQFESTKRLSQLKAIDPTAHWEVARGSVDQNFEYCTKQESRAPGYSPVQHGERDAATQQGRPCAVSDAIRFITERSSDPSFEETEVLESYPSVWARYPGLYGRVLTTRRGRGRLRDVVIELVIGGPGTGKSYSTYACYPDAYRKSPGKWWDGYNGQSVVVFDDFDGTWVTPSELLRILDRYPISLEVKGSFVNLLCTRIVITTNIPVEMWYPKHFETHPDHLKAIKRRITTVKHYHAFGEFTESTGSEYFAPRPVYTGYNPSLISASPPVSPQLFVVDSE